jgi:chromosomal replication initiation ATPase DnaA
MKFDKDKFALIDFTDFWVIESKEVIAELNYKLRVKRLIEDFQHTLSFEDLQGEGRKHGKTLARQSLIYFIKQNTVFSLKGIAEFFGQRDHSTIIHSIKTIEDYLSQINITEDKKLVQKYLNHCKELWECSIAKH